MRIADFAQRLGFPVSVLAGGVGFFVVVSQFTIEHTVGAEVNHASVIGLAPVGQPMRQKAIGRDRLDRIVHRWLSSW